MTKPILCVDIDGVLCDQVEGLRKFSRKKFNINFFTTDITQYEIPEVTPLPQYKMTTIFRDSDYIASLAPMSHAPSVMQLLSNKYEIRILTARWEKETRQATIEWLNEYQIYFDDVIFAKDKLKYCRDYSVSILIEDNFDEAMSIAVEVDSVELALIYEHPWNMNKFRYNNVEYVKSWLDIMRRLLP